MCRHGGKPVSMLMRPLDQPNAAGSRRGLMVGEDGDTNEVGYRISDIRSSLNG